MNPISDLYHNIKQHFEPSFFLEIGAFALSVLGIWRLLRFTIVPLFRPNDPKEIPYWIPFIGHAYSFFTNPQALLSYGMNGVGERQRKPFALTAFGITNYIFTEPTDVACVYKDVEALSFTLFLKATMKSLGIRQATIDTMFTPLPKDKAGFPNPNGKPLAHLSRDLHIKQLYPGNDQTILMTRINEWFNTHLTSSMIASERPYTAAHGQDVVVPLMTFTSDMMVCVGQHVYFGPKLAEIAPNLTWDFLEFDDLSWQLLLQYPSYFCQQMMNAKAKVQVALDKYFELPMEERNGDIWFTKTMEGEMKGIGIPTNEISIMMMTVYWGLTTNARRAAFWVLAYSLYCPGLIEELREETAPAFLDVSKLDSDHLVNKCPKLSAVWQETLRMAASAVSVRFVLNDTDINGYKLRKGNRVLIPFRKLHLDPAVFGQDCKQFRPDRFAKNPELHRYLRAFGGGITLCPGRHMAKLWVSIFVAKIIHRFDLVLEGDQPFPMAQEESPTLGIMASQGDDLQVRLRPRKQ